MAALSESDRLALRRLFMEQLSAGREALALTKDELKAGVDACDQWIDDNAASFNNALPTAARTAMTANQKARLFFIVANRRWEIL